MPNSAVEVLTNHPKKLVQKVSHLKLAAGTALLTVAGSSFADPVTFTLTDASAQIAAGATVIAGVVGTIAAVAAVMKIGRWVIGFFR